MVTKRLEVNSFGGPEVIRVVEDEKMPEPGPGEACIRVEASSLVFTDMLIRRNLYPVLKLTLPLTLGYDLIGRVEAVADNVTTVSPGDRVGDLTQIGSNATHVVRPVEGLVPVPDALDATQAEPLILSYMTAYQALLREGQVPEGGKVLVYGASGAVGNPALDLCGALGFTAVGVASQRRKKGVTDRGAEFVAYDGPDASGHLDRIAREHGGFDAILDVARGEPLYTVLARLKPKGRFVALGFSAPFRQGGASPKGLSGLLGKLRFGLEFLRIKWLSSRKNRPQRVIFYDISGRRAAGPQEFKTDLMALFDMLAAGSIAPRIQRVFTLDNAKEAHELLEAGAVEGRLVLSLEDS